MSNAVPFACPSCVIPASVKENTAFLNGKVSEIALTCFEPSLPNLEDLQPFHGAWHIHLPYLVPHDFYEKYAQYTNFSAQYNEQTIWKNCWEQARNLDDIEKFAQTCIAITKHCRTLNPKHCVLHLPKSHNPNAAIFLEHFLKIWEKELPPDLLCLENVKNASYFDFEKIILSSSCSLCFDIAHALTYEQTTCLDNKAYMNRVKVVHWSAPYEKNSEQKGLDKHLNLNNLINHTDYCIKVLKNIPTTATYVLELFSWEEIEKSKSFFFQLFQQMKQAANEVGETGEVG